ncbi:MAG TPA: symmetrical bis(5'-nucleosyl)-tetraphosphatase [Planctomycetota bacterium]|nr:symmetrical bis(5'-nucleosyl)-tetraphosphatase [Planctomycetota bacterium]
MVTFAIGDVQGCAVTLRRLLDRLRRDAGFDPSRDSLWLVGDLVNRGPHSLDVLRWAHDAAAGRGSEPLGERLHVVLGNHDLHLLALAAGVEKPGKKDTLGDVLSAPDRNELVEWLRRQPLLHAEPVDGRPHVLVHAGLPPGWSVAKATALAAEVHASLSGPDWREAAAAIKRWKPERWDDDYTGGKRLAAIAAALTRLRVVDGRGRMELEFKGPPALAPKGVVPWFAAEGRASTDHVVVCGHWAALGLLLREDVVACDSGCVWGGVLTAVKLAGTAEGRGVVQEKNAEG